MQHYTVWHITMLWHLCNTTRTICVC